MTRLLLSSTMLIGGLALVASAAAQDAPQPPATDTDDVEITATASEPPAPPTSPTPPSTDVPPSAAPPAAPAPAAASPAAAPLPAVDDASAREALLARIDALEAGARLDADREHEERRLLGTLSIRAYVQGQYESSQISQDEVMPGGAPFNRDRFAVRTARLLLTNTWDYASLSAELDANTLRGNVFGIRQAHGSVFWPVYDEGVLPYAALTVGLQDIPFGHELPYGSRRRIFAERSLASRALFPGEPDIGAQVHGGVGPFRYNVAVMNGNPVDDVRSIPAADPNAAKDVVARVGAEAKPSEAFTVSGGLSFLTGKGFHAGEEARKNTLTWTDRNEDGSVQDSELSGALGTAATPSENFGRWAFGADLQLALRTSIGLSRLYGEVTLAKNLDRGLFVADPVASSEDARELGYYVALIQEVTPYGLVGFRTDYYDGNSDFVEQRRGKTLPVDQGVRTYSPLLGLVLPERARLTFQYDIVDDSLARDTRGVPTGLKNNQWTLRLQVGL